MVSIHYETQRSEREKIIEEQFGKGYMVDGFIVDRGHKKGAEVHSIMDNGIIVVHNLKTGKLITKILARPRQIERYYEHTKREHPKEYRQILKLAKQHQILGYNEI